MTAIDTLAITLLAISLSFVPAVAVACKAAHACRSYADEKAAQDLDCIDLLLPPALFSLTAKKLPLWMHVRADLHLWAASVVHSADMAVFSLSQQIKGGRFPGEKSLFTGVFAL